MNIGLVFGFFLLLTMGSLILTLISSSQLDKLKQQNGQMKAQIDQLKKEYNGLFQRLKEMESQVAEEDGDENPAVAGAATVFGAAPAAKTKQRTTNLDTMSDNDKLEIVKANAYRLQSVTENFSLQNGGRYPDSLGELEQYANATATNEVLTNPFSRNKGPVASAMMSLDITVNPADEGNIENAGKLLFQANSDDEGNVTDYTIAAFDQDALLLRNDEGNVFTLTHT